MQAQRESAMFKLDDEDLTEHGDEVKSIKRLAAELGGNEAHYVLVCGAGSNCVNGIYGRIRRRHEDAAVYVSGSGVTISREIISGKAGHVLGQWPDVLYGNCLSEDGMVPFKQEWKAFSAKPPGCRVFRMNQNVMRICGHLRILRDQERPRGDPAWAWVEGSSLLIAQERGGRVICEIDMVEYDILDGDSESPETLLALAKDTRRMNNKEEEKGEEGTGPDEVRFLCPTLEDKILWIATLEVLITCFRLESESTRQSTEHTEGSSLPVRKKRQPKPLDYGNEALNDDIVRHFREMKAKKRAEKKLQAKEEERRLKSLPVEEQESKLAEEKARQQHQQQKDRMLKAQLGQYAKVKR